MSSRFLRSPPTSNPIYNGQCCAPASFNEDYVAAARDMNPYFVGPPAARRPTRSLDLMLVAWARPVAHASGVDAGGWWPVRHRRMTAVLLMSARRQRRCTPVRQRRSGQDLRSMPRWDHNQTWRPNKRVELTPLRGPKIAAFLKEGNSSTTFPIYRAAQLTRKPLDGRINLPSMRSSEIPGLSYNGANY